MRRFITITIIILIVVSILLGGAWYFSRQTAIKNGAEPMSFRQFLTGQSGTASTPNDTPRGLSSSFTDDTTPANIPDTGALPAPGTQSSTFTSTTLSPDTASPETPPSGGTTPGQGAPIPPPGQTIPGQSTGTTPPSTTPGSPTVFGTTCSETDLNIVFTPEELQELRLLQNRFYAVADTLHTDGDVLTEGSNHDAFRAKNLKNLELYSYCSQKTPLLTSAPLKQRVRTPFWRDPSKPNDDFFLYGGNPPLKVQFTGTDAQAARVINNALEPSLRLNLW